NDGDGAGSGDNDVTPHYPSNYDSTVGTASVPGAAYDNVIAVAAINRNGQLSTFSNWGPTSVDLAAPGEQIYSTLPGGRYGAFSGTSTATPHVTGAAALYASIHPGASAAEIKSALLRSAFQTPTPSLTGLTRTGGRLYLPAAVQASGADPN